MHTQNKSTFDLSLQFSSQIYSIVTVTKYIPLLQLPNIFHCYSYQIYSIVTVTKYIPLLQLPNIKSGRRGRVRMDW
jgi:hypothetical protein